MYLGTNCITSSVFSPQLLLMIPMWGLPADTLIDTDVMDDCGLRTLASVAVGHFALRLHQILIIFFTVLDFKPYPCEWIFKSLFLQCGNRLPTASLNSSPEGSLRRHHSLTAIILGRRLLGRFRICLCIPTFTTRAATAFGCFLSYFTMTIHRVFPLDYYN